MAAPIFDLWKTDFVMEWEGRLIKVNVKTMSKAPNAYHVTLQTGGAIDFFGIVNLEYDHIWMVPLEAVAHRTLVSWIPDSKRKNRISRRAFKWDQYLIK